MAVRDWLDSLYSEPESRNPVARFHSILDQYIGNDDTVLDLGAGAGLNNYDLRGKVGTIIGVDLDPRVMDNQLIDEGYIADVADLPFPDEYFDVVFSIYVLEHVDEPAKLVDEVSRVLRPGGLFIALTPNKYHYVSVIARLTSNRFHRWFNKNRGVDPTDVFPTKYKMNTRRTLKRLFEERGFSTRSMEAIEVRPNYLMFSTPTFLMGALYERVVNSTPLLTGLRVNFIPVFQKDGQR